MSTKAKNIILIILIAFIIAGTVYYFLKKKKIKAKVLLINEAIDNKVGLLGADVDSTLASVTESSFTPLPADITAMNSSNADTIIKALAGKTKSQIKKMFSVYLATYKMKFNDHLNDAFDHWYGYDDDSYSKVLFVVNSAK